MNTKDFYGDNVRWFTGLVVSHTPPAGFEGMVKVRIRGIHSDSTVDIKESDLPWAQVMIPSTEAGVSGLGKNVGIKSGATVFGFFVDGESSQVPLVLGALPVQEQKTDVQKSKNVDVEERVISLGEIGKEKFSNVDSLEELTFEFKKSNREISEMVVHWTETYTDSDIGSEEIDKIFKKSGSSIGYHYVIRRDGTVQRGVSLNEMGNHTPEYNHNKYSIGVIFVGGINCAYGTENPLQYVSSESLTNEQYKSFDKVVRAFFTAFPWGQVFGHSEVRREGTVEDLRPDPGFVVSEYIQKNFRRSNYYNEGLIEEEPLTKSEAISAMKGNI